MHHRSTRQLQLAEVTSTMIIWIFVHIVLLLIGPFLIKVLAISCYECNQFPHESKSPCPASQTVNYGFLYDVSFRNLDGKLFFHSKNQILIPFSKFQKIVTAT